MPKSGQILVSDTLEIIRMFLYFCLLQIMARFWFIHYQQDNKKNENKKIKHIRNCSSINHSI